MHGIQPYASASQEILDRLEAAGLNAVSLMRKWQVILWSVRVKEGEIKFKLHLLGYLNEEALQETLQRAVGPDLKVRIKLKPLSKCCQSACEGCLYGNETKRREWVDAVLPANRV